MLVWLPSTVLMKLQMWLGQGSYLHLEGRHLGQEFMIRCAHRGELLSLFMLLHSVFISGLAALLAKSTASPAAHPTDLEPSCQRALGEAEVQHARETLSHLGVSPFE